MLNKTRRGAGVFGRTRRRIVFTVVFSLFVLMAVTLTTIYLSNRMAIRRENEEMLRAFAERYTPEGQPPDADGRQEMRPGGWPDGDFGKGAEQPGRPDEKGRIRNESAFRLSTFYSVAYSLSGEVLAVSNGGNGYRSEEALLETAAAILNSGKTGGDYGSVTYLVENRASYTLVAMIDNTITDNSQHTLFRQMLIIGAAAMAVLAVISVFLARRIVRPLEENDRRQKRFVSDAGHELKTPIAVISANSELLRRETGESEWLNNIDYENRRMSDLVRQLLSLSRAENGDLPKETLDLSRLAGGEVLPFESLAFEAGVTIDSEIEPDIFVEGNPGQLCQLVSILLDNALAHGTGKQIGFTLARDKHSAVLTVTNEAKELDSEQLANLFDRFYRADESRSESGTHYGLGLSIAGAVTEAHGGTIKAAYKDGKAVFTVTLPMKKHGGKHAQIG